MRRLLLAVAILVAVSAAPAQAITKEYSTGNITTQIGGHRDKSINVPDAGPVSFVRVSFRISVPDTSALAVSLVSPKGTEVPLVVGRGHGADFGSGEKGCGSLPTEFDSDTPDNPVATGAAPFTELPYTPEGSLESLFGQDARGRWTLRIKNGGPPAILHCFTLDISRDVSQFFASRHGSVAAAVSFTERNFFFEKARLKIVRAGRTALDAPLAKVGCRDCAQSRPVDIKVRDLDGGEPEVLVDLYTGGAHCCTVSLILRWDAAAHRYRSTYVVWGNYGRRLVDLDHDGLPEFSAFDERFIYAYSAYVFSAAPTRISSYRRGRLVDVTREYPAAIRRDAGALWKNYLSGRGQKDIDVRSYVAAYVADQYLLGKPDDATRALDLALKRGDLGRGNVLLGLPAGRAFVKELLKDLRTWGYVTA